VERAEAREVWRNHEAARDVRWDALNGSTAGPWLLVVENAEAQAVLQSLSQRAAKEEPRMADRLRQRPRPARCSARESASSAV